jgi:hypothetical protein
MEQPCPHVGSYCTDRPHSVLHSETQPAKTLLSCPLPQHLPEWKETCSPLAEHVMLRPNQAEFKKLFKRVLLCCYNCLSPCDNYTFISPLTCWFNVVWCSHHLLCKPSVNLEYIRRECSRIIFTYLRIMSSSSSCWNDGTRKGCGRKQSWPSLRHHLGIRLNRRNSFSVNWPKLEPLHTYLLTPWSTSLLEKLTDPQLVTKFHAFYGNWKFINSFTSARHLSLSWASLIQFLPPHPTSGRSILILASHRRLGIPRGLFPRGFHTKTPYAPLLSHTRATCPAHLILLCLTPEQYWVRSTSH